MPKKKNKLDRLRAKRDSKRSKQAAQRNAQQNSILAGGLGVVGEDDFEELDPNRLPACLMNHSLAELVGSGDLLKTPHRDDDPVHADSDETSPAMELLAASYETSGDEVYEAAVEKLLESAALADGAMDDVAAREAIAEELAEWEGMIQSNPDVQEMIAPDPERTQLRVVFDDGEDEPAETRETEQPETDDSNPEGDGDDDGEPMFADNHPPLAEVTIRVITPQERLAACHHSSAFPARKGAAAQRQHEINSRMRGDYFAAWDVPSAYRERVLDTGVNRWKFCQNKKAFAAAVHLLERLMQKKGTNYDLSAYWRHAGDFVSHTSQEAASWKLLQKKCQKFKNKGQEDHNTIIWSLWNFVFNAERQKGKITHFEYNVIASDQDAWKGGFLADLVACDLITKANARAAMRMFKLKIAA